MEQSPLVGYLKVSFIAILAFVVFLNVWSGGKTEDKITRLDQSVQELRESIRDLSKTLEEQRTYLDRLAGANETLLKAIAAGGLRAPEPKQGASRKKQRGAGIDLGLKRKESWGWHLNKALDKDLDPGRPIGAPGRYKNLLRPDPDGPESARNPGNTDGTLRTTWGPEPKGFNFVVENYAALTNLCEEYVMSYPGRRHKRRPSSFNWKPGLAWRIEVNPDYSEYTIFLRRDAYWQPVQADTRIYPHLKGKHKLTAHDFKFTYGVILDEQSNVASIRSYYKDMKSVEVLDDYTLVYRWTPNTFESLGYSMRGRVMPRFIYAYDEAGKPYPEETVAQEFNNHWYDQLRLGPVGCGPYRFTRYEQGKFIELERWDDWFGFKDEPLFGLKKLHYKIYNESETAFNWLRKGDIDVGGLNGTRFREWIQEETDTKSPFMNGDILNEIAPRTGYVYFGWKNSDPMFSDRRVRQAMTYAFDRVTVCDKIFNKRYVPMAAPIYPHSEEANPDLKPYPFDIEKAKRLLDEAGWRMNQATGLREKVIDGKRVEFRFTLHWPGPSAEFQNALDQYKNDLLKCGIEMTPLSVQWAQYLKDLQDRKYKAISLGWDTDGWEHDFKQIWHSRQIKDPGSSNTIEFSNKALDALQDELDHTMDPKRRIEIIHRIGKILYDEQPYTFFAWQRAYRCHWKQVKGWDRYLYNARPLPRWWALWIDRKK